MDLGSASVLTKALGAFTSVGALKAPSLDTAGAAVLPVGGATATEVDLGRSGQPVKILGTVSGAFSDLRTVAAIYNTTTAQSIGSGAGLVVVNFGTKVLDTDNAVTTGAGWAFTVPAGKGGLFHVSANIAIAFPTATQIDILPAVLVNGVDTVNGNRLSFLSGTLTTSLGVVVTGHVVVSAGDTIAVAVAQTSGGSRVLDGFAQHNRVSRP